MPCLSGRVLNSTADYIMSLILSYTLGKNCKFKVSSEGWFEAGGSIAELRSAQRRRRCETPSVFQWSRFLPLPLT